jgi:hypothetical protein
MQARSVLCIRDDAVLATVPREHRGLFTTGHDAELAHLKGPLVRRTGSLPTTTWLTGGGHAFCSACAAARPSAS